jgi:hypothetical protein
MVFPILTFSISNPDISLCCDEWLFHSHSMQLRKSCSQGRPRAGIQWTFFVVEPSQQSRNQILEIPLPLVKLAPGIRHLPLANLPDEAQRTFEISISEDDTLLPLSLNATDDEDKMNRILPATRLLDIAAVRLYIAYPEVQDWKFTGLSGLVVLGQEINSDVHFLKFVDMVGPGQVLWELELGRGFQYNQGRDFRHIFEMDGISFGLSFTEESRGQWFFENVSASKESLGNFLLDLRLTYRIRNSSDSAECCVTVFCSLGDLRRIYT